MLQRLLMSSSESIKGNATLSLEDSLVKLSALPENEKGLRIQGERYSLKLLGQLKKSNHLMYYWRMSKGYSLTTRGELSEQSFKRWMNWGISSNGACLTANFGEYHKIERVYILLTRKDVWKEPKLFKLLKQQTEVNSKLIEVLESNIDEKFFIDDEKTDILLSNVKNDFLGVDEEEQVADYRYDEGLRVRKDKIAPCLRANNKSMGADHLDLSNTFFLLQPKILNNLRIRKLTPLECWRLQGFKDEQFLKAKAAGVSNSQLYKQAGNSVSVPVVSAIIKEMFQ